MKRHPAVALVALTLVVGGCSSSDDAPDTAAATSSAAPSTTVAATTTSTVPATTAPSTTQPGSQRCSSSSLALSSAEGRAALGHALYMFRLRNTSGQPCRLEGHPDVALLDGGGRVLVRAKPGAGYILPDRPPRPVPLAAGASAWFGLEASTLCDGDATPTPSVRMAVTPPGDGGALSAAVTIDVCPEDAVLVSPVRARDSEVAG
ncbi:MAG TPA: DUF4232 domain-containing protein [Acidimicrobiales bacterium]|nr:DUF4232 domain-containing protein [Acidimicrobiales bacterium]